MESRWRNRRREIRTRLRNGVRSQHRHYPYWYEGCLSTRLSASTPAWSDSIVGSDSAVWIGALRLHGGHHGRQCVTQRQALFG